MTMFWAALEPHLIEMIGVLLTLLLTLATARLRAWTGIEIEARHRDALHGALMTGVRTAITDSPGAARDLMVEKAVAYARLSVPGAIRALAPNDFILGQLARRYAAEMLDAIRPGS